MKINIQKETLIEVLQIVTAISDKSGMKPILANFLMKTEKEGIEVSATNYELSVIGKFKAEVLEEGTICINAKRLYDACREFKESAVVMTSLSDLWIEITNGSTKLKLASIDAGLYPKVEQNDFLSKITITAQNLKRYANMTLFASQTNESRRNLMGVCLSTLDQNTSRWIATDGHRLARILTTHETIEYEELQEIIIPRYALQEIIKTLPLFGSELQIVFDEMSLQFIGENIIFKTRLIDGKFPNCDPIIPKESDCEIQLKARKEELIYAIKIVSLISYEKIKPIKLTLMNHKLVLESEKGEYGEIVDEIDIEYEGETFQIGFNAKYLLDVLHVIEGDTVQICFRKDAMAAALIKDAESAEFLSVLMPLRIEW